MDKWTGKGKFYGWTTLSVAALVYFLTCGVLLHPFGVFLPFVCEEFGWGRGSVAGAYTMMMVSVGIVGPFAGKFITKYGSRVAMVLGNLMAVSGLILLAYHKHIWQFYIGYGVLIGSGIGFGGFIAATTIANNWFDKKRSLALSIVISTGGLGGLLLIPCIMTIINRVGWRSTYVVLSIVAILFMVVVPWLFIRNKPEDLQQTPDGETTSDTRKTVSTESNRQLVETPVDFTLGEAIRTLPLWLIMIAGALQLFAVSMLIAHQIAFLVDIGISAGVAAASLGLLTGTSTMGRLGAGFLGLRYNMRFLAIGSYAILTVGMFLAMFANSLVTALVYITVYGIGYGAYVVASAGLVSQFYGQANFPVILGLITFFAVIGSVGAPIAGVFYDSTGSYSAPFTIAAVTLLVGLVCIILARPPKHSSLTS